jgi:iron(III) transport system ATP-binding protein
MSTTIRVNQLVKTYPAIAPAPGSPPTTTAVDHVSLTIDAGELFFLLGPSGCGKTTLLRMIAGFIEPTQGQILFVPAATPDAPVDVTHLPPNKRNTGMVFQSYALWPHMSIEDNVAFGLEIRKIDADQRRKRVMEALETVQMAQYAKRKPTQLSGGQQQRVALARAIVIRPAVLLLDEPLSNLDAKLRIELRSEIRRICKQAGTTTVYVTHDQKEALSMADRMAIMRAGQLVEQGTPEDLYRRPGSRFVAEFLGETNILQATPSSHEQNVSSATFQTPAGPLVAAKTGSDFKPGQPALLSIRPEAIRFTSVDRASLKGTITGRVYLGEQAHYEVKLGSGTQLRVAISNPGRTSLLDGIVGLEIDPEDVVVMPLN